MKRSRDELHPRQLKHAAAIRRPIYLCPIPARYFKIPVLAWAGQRAIDLGHDPSALTFFSMLRKNRRFLLPYVVFGLLDDKGEVIVSTKDWPERVLEKVPNDNEILHLFLEDASRFKRPDRWVSEKTAEKLAAGGHAYIDESGMIKFGDLDLAVSHHIPDDRMAYSWSAMVHYPIPCLQQAD